MVKLSKQYNMMELNKEISDGILDVLEYLKLLYTINPKLNIPLSFISPAISMDKYKYVLQSLDKPLFYNLILLN